MPELPEVETIARRLEPELVGRTIKEADLHLSRTLAAPAPKKFKEQVKGQQCNNKCLFCFYRRKDFFSA